MIKVVYKDEVVEELDHVIAPQIVVNMINAGLIIFTHLPYQNANQTQVASLDEDGNVILELKD